MIEMESNLVKEFNMQEEVDQLIYKTHKVKDPNRKRDELILALFDEVCELMNKMRIHKFWSNKGMNERSDLLEEYVDTWHFLLSVGNIIGAPQEHYGLEIRKAFTNQFRVILFTLNDVFTPIGWQLVVSQWKGLGHMMGFTDEEVRAAFIRKHEINIKRQKEGY
jgi:dimeric dUTPase (all-alpha-NTP-PPase superfamily)